MKKLYFIFLNFFLYNCIQTMEEQSLLLNLKNIINNKKYSQRLFSRFQLSDEEELDIINEISTTLTNSLNKISFQLILRQHPLISSALFSTISKMANYCAQVEVNTIETISSTGFCKNIPYNMKDYLYYKALKLLRGWANFTIELPHANPNGLLCLSELCYKVAVESNKQLLLYCLKTMAIQEIAPLTSDTNYVLFNRKGTYLALANNSNKVSLYKSDTGELLQDIIYPDTVNRLYFSSQKNSLLAYCFSNKYTYISHLKSDGMYDTPEELPMKPNANFITTKTKNYEVGVPFSNKVTIYKKLSPSFIVCLKAIDNTSDKNILLNIKSTEIFNTLDLVEKNCFDTYMQDKIKRLKEIEKTSVAQSKRLGLFVDMF